MDIAAAIAHYDALLEGDAAMARASGEMLMARQPGARLMFGTRPLCSCLRPQFLDAAFYSFVQQTCAVLAGASRKLEAAMLADPRLLAEVDLTEMEQRLVLIDPGYEDAAASTRLDSFVAGESWKFVEYNAESPAAMAYTDVLADLFHELPVMQAFERRYRVRALPTSPMMLEALLRAYHQWGGRGSPLIAIVDWSGLPTATEFALFQEFFARHGYTALILEPRDLEYRNGRLYGGGQAIDIVYRRVLTHELLARLDDAPALVQAYEARAVCVVNAFRCKLLHKKAIFALLSDEANTHLFSDAERQAIQQHIPWTRKVREGYTTYDGRRIDLTAFILENRERLVLKPNDEYGGKGVVLGWETEPVAWEEALQGALASSSVVQERVATERSSYPIYQDGRVQFVDLTADLDPYLFGRQVAGLLTRVSAAALLNVTAGAASTVPTFILENLDT